MALVSTLFCGSVLCTCVTADNPDDRTFGNGRFLRRLRDDVVKRTKLEPKKKEEGKDPTPAKRPAKGEPTLATRPSKAMPAQNRRPSAAPTAAAKNSKELSNGFGMQIESRNDQLIVTKTDARGNAVEAGVRNGDIVVGAGGVEIKSVEELQEITKILGNGDQLEFEISRRGQEKKVLIQFGEAPEESEVVVSKPKTPAKQVSNYNFLPEPAEPKTGNFRSVLNDSTTRREINRTPQSVTQPPAATRLNNADPQLIIDQQRRQIEQLRREVQRLQQSNSKANRPSSKWSSLNLLGPKK